MMRISAMMVMMRCGVAGVLMGGMGMVEGSAEGGVSLRMVEVVVKADEAGYGFRFSMDDEGGLARVQVEWGGKVSDFSVKHFGAVERCHVQGVRVMAPTSNSRGKQDEVIVMLPYRVGRVVMGDGELRDQWDVVRLHFDKGELVMWERAEAMKGQQGKWKLTSWGEMEGDVITKAGEVEGKVLDQGITEEETNPYHEGPVR